MKASNLADVGQILRSKGISINMMMKEEMLQRMIRSPRTLNALKHLQADNAKGNHKVGVENVRDSQCEAKDYAQNSRPICDVSEPSLVLHGSDRPLSVDT